MRKKWPKVEEFLTKELIEKQPNEPGLLRLKCLKKSKMFDRIMPRSDVRFILVHVSEWWAEGLVRIPEVFV